MDSWVQIRADGLVPMRFAIFPFHLCKSAAPATKKWCQVIRSAVTPNHPSKPENLMLPNATTLRKSAPWPPIIFDEHVFCFKPATQNASVQILFKSPTPANAFETATKRSLFAHFWPGAKSLAHATQNNIWTSKSAPNPSGFYTFDLEMCFAPQRRALFQHVNFQKYSENGVFWTFWLRNLKVLRAEVLCIHFDFETCVAPQLHALFRHLNF